jgi:hypothetical protein
MLPGDGQGNAPGGMGKHLMDALGGGQDAGSKVADRLGQLIGASQLADQQQQSVFEDKSLVLQERTAQNTGQLVDIMMRRAGIENIARLAP